MRSSLDPLSHFDRVRRRGGPWWLSLVAKPVCGHASGGGAHDHAANDIARPVLIAVHPLPASERDGARTERGHPRLMCFLRKRNCDRADVRDVAGWERVPLVLARQWLEEERIPRVGRTLSPHCAFEQRLTDVSEYVTHCDMA